MEPTIYKPGAYKSPGVYKAPGIYKGRGVYNDGEGGVINAKYLTYYSNYDANLKTDYPIFGQNTTYTENPLITNESWGGVLKTFAEPATIGGLLKSDLFIDANDDIFSVEFVVEFSSIASGYANSGIGFFNENDEHLAAACLTNFVGFEIVDQNIDLKNGFTVNRIYEGRAYIMPPSNVTGIYKVSFVFDKNTNKLKSYYNGVLGCISNFSYNINGLKIYMYKAFNEIFKASQVAYFVGDRSINEGDNYPIEPEPYIK